MEMENSIIDIRNLLWNTIKQWRKIVIGIIIGAVIIGGYGAYSAMKTATADVSGTQAELDALNVQMQELVDSKTIIDEYIDESLYMNMDYLNVVNTIFTVHMTAISKINESAEAVTNPVSDLVNTYNWKARDEALYQEINTQLGYSTNYTDQIFTTQPDSGAGFINFIIQSNSQEDNETVANIIIKYLEDSYDEINQTIYVHELTVSTMRHSNITLETINSHQAVKQAELKNLTEDITELQEKITAAEQVVADQSNTTKQIITVVIFIIIGMILGGGATIFFLLVLPLVFNKIQGGRYIELEHNMTVLGTKPLLVPGKNGIDNMIWKFGSKRNVRTEDDFLNYVVQAINVKTNQGERVHLAGTIGKEKIQVFYEQIQGLVHATLTYGGDIADEMESLAQLAEADSVILVEGTFATTDRALEREMYQINKLNKNIKGVVLL